MFQYPERCPRCNNILSSSKTCPSCDEIDVSSLLNDGGYLTFGGETTGQSFTSVDYENSQTIDLCLRVTTGAAKQIRDLANEHFYKNFYGVDEDKKTRDGAERWIRVNFGQNNFLAYIFNGGKSQDGSQNIEIRIATDSYHTNNISFVNSFNNQTLTLLGVEKTGDNPRNKREKIFLLTRVLRMPGNAGHYDKILSLPVNLRFTETTYEPGFSKAILRALTRLPEAFTHKKIIEQKINQWSAYLELMEKKLSEKRYEVPYIAIRQGKGKFECIFLLDDHQPMLWERIKRSRGGYIHVLPQEKVTRKIGDIIEEDEEFLEQSWKLGKIDEVNELRKAIIVLLDEDVVRNMGAGKFSIPNQGVLIYKAEGDEIFINRMKWGMGQLSRRQSENVNLGDFIFQSGDARGIDLTKKIRLARENLLIKEIFDNKEQMEAVEGALSAPDLYLIQGPPGTGKTTVIAEICYQIAKQGGRTLISSQTNLAVDNVLSRLVHDPIIRSLRRGKAERVEEEGLPFIEENIISTWLTKTAQMCRYRLDKANNRLLELSVLTKNGPEIMNHLETIFTNEKKIYRVKKQVTTLEQQIKNIEKEKKQVNEEYEDFESVLNQFTSNSFSVTTQTATLLQAQIGLLTVTARNHLFHYLDEIVLDINQKAVENSVNIKVDSSIDADEQEYLKYFFHQLDDIINKYSESLNLHTQLQELSKNLFTLSVFVSGYARRVNIAKKQLNDINNILINIHNSFNGMEEEDEQLSNEANMIFKKDIRDIRDNISQIKKKRDTLFQELIKTREKCLLIFPGIIPHPLKKPYHISSSEGYDLWVKTIREVMFLTDNRIQQLNDFILEYTTETICKKIIYYIFELANSVQKRMNEIDNLLVDLNSKKSLKLNQITKLEEQCLEIRKWSDQFAKNLPEILKRYHIDRFLDNEEIYMDFKKEAENWSNEEKFYKDFIKKYKNFVLDWAHRLDERDAQDVSELRQIYIDNANVIGITCGQSGARKFSQEFRNFDCVVVDEVTKATPPELILPLLKGKKVVLVGDHKQLPPMLGIDTLNELATSLRTTKDNIKLMKRAIFQDLFEQSSEDLRTMLRIQYRMHPQIMDAINQFYGNIIELGLDNPDKKLDHALDGFIDRKNHIVWIDIPIHDQYHEKRDGTSFYNEVEIELAEIVVNRINEAWERKIRSGKNKKEIGVITFYASQSTRLYRNLLNRTDNNAFKYVNLRVGTVDRFQGMERPIIIASLVRNNNQGEIGFAKEPERINVAFSRAQELLIIIGCATLFTQNISGPYGGAKKFYQHVYDIALINNSVLLADSLLNG